MNLSSRLSRFWRSAAGLSALEFALMAPILVCVYFGSIEISTMMITDRKLASAVTTVGDLAAREEELNTAEITNILNAGILSMTGPVRHSGETRDTVVLRTRFRITSVEWNASGTQTVVAWSRSTGNWSPRQTGANVDVSTDLVSTGGSIIFTEVEYDYSSITGLFDPEAGLPIDVSRTLTAQHFTRPRRIDSIPIS